VRTRVCVLTGGVVPGERRTFEYLCGNSVHMGACASLPDCGRTGGGVFRSFTCMSKKREAGEGGITRALARTHAHTHDTTPTWSVQVKEVEESSVRVAQLASEGAASLQRIWRSKAESNYSGNTQERDRPRRGGTETDRGEEGPRPQERNTHRNTSTETPTMRNQERRLAREGSPLHKGSLNGGGVPRGLPHKSGHERRAQGHPPDRCQRTEERTRSSPVEETR
jgi:hypothetical protein